MHNYAFFGNITPPPQSTEIFNLNFQSHEVVSRYRDPQLQVTEIFCDLRNLSPKIYQCFKIGGIFYSQQPINRGYTCANKTQNVYCSRHQSSTVAKTLDEHVL